jgi:hypothetical protein
MDYVIEAVTDVFAKREHLRDMRITEATSTLRHFTAKFAEARGAGGPGPRDAQRRRRRSPLCSLFKGRPARVRSTGCLGATSSSPLS